MKQPAVLICAIFVFVGAFQPIPAEAQTPICASVFGDRQLASAASALGIPSLGDSLLVSQLTAEDGSLYLIREINGAYQPGFQGFFSKVTGWTSYSIDPFRYLSDVSVGATVGDSMTVQRTVLIAKQKFTQELEFNSVQAVGFVKLSPTTKIGDISATYHEIRIRPVDENVIRVMSHDDFVTAMASVGSVNSPAEYREMIVNLLEATKDTQVNSSTK